MGFVQLPPATVAYAGVLTTTSTTGLAAPGNVFFDRLRTLFVAGRSQNGGTAGVYVYSAASGSSPILEVARTGSNFQNVIDVRPRPALVGFSAPLDPADPSKFVINASSSASVSNALLF